MYHTRLGIFPNHNLLVLARHSDPIPPKYVILIEFVSLLRGHYLQRKISAPRPNLQKHKQLKLKIWRLP